MNTGDTVTGPINLGNPTENTMLELAEKIIALTGSRSELKFHPLPTDDPRQRRPDISKATTTLKWAPRIALDEGLRRTIAYFEGVLSRRQNEPELTSA
jgi:UDP-glucuronate decarboxylase